MSNREKITFYKNREKLTKTIPADVHGVAQVIGVKWICAWLKVTDVKVGERVIDKAMHCSIGAVHVLVDESWDEVRCESDDKRL